MSDFRRQSEFETIVNAVYTRLWVRANISVVKETEPYQKVTLL
jgi:hypothetical protein